MNQNNSYKDIIKALDRFPDGLTEGEIQIFCWGYHRSSRWSNKKYAEMLRRAIRNGFVIRELRPVGKCKYIYRNANMVWDKINQHEARIRRDAKERRQKAKQKPRKETRAKFQQLLYEFIYETYLPDMEINVAKIRKDFEEGEIPTHLMVRFEQLEAAYDDYIGSCKFWKIGQPSRWKFYDFERLNRHLKSIAENNIGSIDYGRNIVGHSSKMDWRGFTTGRERPIYRDFIIVCDRSAPMSLCEYKEIFGQTKWKGYKPFPEEEAEMADENAKMELQIEKDHLVRLLATINKMNKTFGDVSMIAADKIQVQELTKKLDEMYELCQDAMMHAHMELEGMGFDADEILYNND